jgi:outer membrane protein assembly factor BamB
MGQQLDKIVPADGASGDHFGHDISMQNGSVLIGSRFHGGTGYSYLYQLGSGLSPLEFTSNDHPPNHDFGTSVSISGNRALVGAAGDDNANFNAGAGYIFNIVTGQQTAKLVPTLGYFNGDLGWSGALDGNTAILGMLPIDFAGNAYLFDATTGGQLHVLTPSTRPYLEQFGYSVGISGNRAIVGAPSYFSFNSGSVYVFDTATGQQLSRLEPDQHVPDARFGFSVDIEGNRALVGATMDNDNGTGSAYLFDLTTGQQLRKFVAADGLPADGFGFSVDLLGDRALIGAWNGEYNGIRSGNAYLFDINTGAQLAKLGPNDGIAGYHFGHAVAMNSGRALVGARDDGTGSVYVFDIQVPEPSLAILLFQGCVLAPLRRNRAR